MERTSLDGAACSVVAGDPGEVDAQRRRRRRRRVRCGRDAGGAKGAVEGFRLPTDDERGVGDDPTGCEPGQERQVFEAAALVLRSVRCDERVRCALDRPGGFELFEGFF